MSTHNPYSRHAADAQPVRIVAGNPIAESRAREARLITAALTAVCTVATGCAIVPAVDRLVTALVLAVLAGVLTAGVLRVVIRRVRWWIEDRADVRTAATWRAQHTQPADQGAQDCPARAGVA
jgi:hypothetical protein